MSLATATVNAATAQPSPAPSMDALNAPEHQATTHEHVLTSEFEPKRVICLPVDASEASVNTIKWVIANFGLNKETDQVVLLNTRPYTVPDLAVAYPCKF